jgi:hypothetical protein
MSVQPVTLCRGVRGRILFDQEKLFMFRLFTKPLISDKSNCKNETPNIRPSPHLNAECLLGS